MKKTKKLLSLLTALTITASAFSAFVIPAHAAAQVYVNESFTYADGDIIASYGAIGATAADKPADVTKGNLVYKAGVRNNGSLSNKASIASNELVISADDYSSNKRGISFEYTDVTIPKVADIENTEILETSMKVKATQSFAILGFGDITTADLTTTTDYVKLRAILDKSASKKYLIVTDTSDKVLSTKTEALASADVTFTGMEFFKGAGTFNIDDLKVEVKTKDIGTVTFAAKDGDEAALKNVKVKVNTGAEKELEFTTGADSNTVEVALPNGTYSAAASKDGYEHTEGLKDAHIVSDIVVNSDTTTVNFVLSQMHYQKIPDIVNVTGGQNFVAAPKTATPNKTAAFTVEVIDQENVAMAADEYVLDWAIYPAGTTTEDPNVTIDQNGVVSVSQAFRANNNTAFYDVTAVADANGRSTKATATLCVGNSDIIYYEPVAWDTTDRTGKKTFVSETSFDGTIAVNVNTTIYASSSSRDTVWRALAIKSVNDKLCGILYRKSDSKIYAWTGYKGGDQFNQYNDTYDDKFDHIAELVSEYKTGTNLNVTFTIDPTTKNITAECNGTSVLLPYSITATKITGAEIGRYDEKDMQFKLDDITIQEPDEDYLSISGDDKFAKVYGATVTRDYTLGMSVIDPEETFNWTVVNSSNAASDAVTVADGRLSVSDTAVPDTYKITATSSKNANKTATYSVLIGDFRADGDTDSGKNMEVTLSGAYAYDPAKVSTESGDVTPSSVKLNSVETITTAVDATGDTIKVTSAKAQDAVLIQATYSGSALASVKTSPVTLKQGENTLTAVEKVSGATVLLWNKLSGADGMKSIVGETAQIEADDPIENAVGQYSLVSVKDTYEDVVTDILPDPVWTSSDENVAKVSASTGEVALVGPGTTTITATINNGTKQNGDAAVLTKTIPLTVATYSITGNADGNSTTVDTTALVQNADIAKYMVTTATNAGVKVKQTEVNKADLIKADYAVDTTGADKYEIAPIFEKSFDDMGTLGTYDAGYNFSAPADTYNFVLNTTGSRADIYATNQMLVNNIMQSGGSASVNVNDIVISDNVVNITGSDYDTKNGHPSSDTKATVMFYKSPTIVNREKKMYVLGDSLVCVYYNGGSDSNVTAQTGWGQVMDKFVKNVEVVDLGNSGVTANGLLGSAFTQVLQSAQDGDIMILESGYNDRTYDTEATMKNAVTEMVTKAKAKGVKVVLVSPNASQHDYKADVSWTSKMKAVADETSTDYIDLAKLSYDFLSDRFGTDTDAVKATCNVSDGLHSQYRAAVKYASIVAGQLLGFSGYTDIVDTTKEYTYQDSKGNNFTCQAVAPVTP